MFPNFPFNRVNWVASGFLIATFLTAVIGTPLYIRQFGLDWFQVALFLVYFILTGLSITLGYHRLFAHRSFVAKWPVRLSTLVFGACAFEDSALDWASDHRDHHKHTDTDDDPYNIQKGFVWAHIGWIFFKLYPREMNNVADLRKDSLVLWQHQHHRTIAVLVGFVLPALLGLAWNGWVGALGGFLIAGVTRVVCVQHCTFFINSLCHCMGNRPYSSRTSARDSWFMALFTFGEGYHNYHHSFQHDYRNGAKNWQFDPTKWTIWVLERAGLVSDLRRAAPEKVLLAELREARLQAEQRLAELEDVPPHAWHCPNWRMAFDSVQEMSAAFTANYAELEKAVAEHVRVSGKRLRLWKSHSARLLEGIAELSRLQIAYC
ncbi:MAG: stearoyl-CoA desaturase (delta-9 desaturase) [Verrucomicrobia bacterium]|jgi:stearoyl-CoA desaturase (delta-9 desaturase)|nr:MAG: stearoyl-CoA desaturase (delta-9 desaturase) [Verrucomicrobiota bacterium]